MIRITKRVSKNRLSQLQELVKQHNGRFVGFNPDDIIVESAFLCVTFDKSEDCNNFSDDWYRLTTPITESKSGFIKRITNKVKGFFKSL